ncbi:MULTISPECIES: hypothetical protein [Streptomyces]|uniref:hypothetical protein n=1 Tax=Streptomyces TaxID=1883 RepID=UPI001F058CE3|nr:MULTISPECIES: hypothetical protein [Streptomyces]
MPGCRGVAVGGGHLGQGQRPGHAHEQMVTLAHPGDQAQDPPVVTAPVEFGDDELAVQPAQQGAGVGVRGE